jgi:hypothetical protein
MLFVGPDCAVMFPDTSLGKLSTMTGETFVVINTKNGVEPKTTVIV